MSSFDTKVEGKADQLVSLSDWLSTSLGPAVDGAGDQLASVKLDVGSEWEGQTADAVVSWAGSAVTDCDSISSSISSVATAVSTYSTVLSEVCQEAEWIRQDAVAAGLTVSGTVVHMPTDKEDEDYETKVETYNSLSIRMSDASTTLAAGQSDLRGSLDDALQTTNSVLKVFDPAVSGTLGWLVSTVTHRFRYGYAQDAATYFARAAREGNLLAAEEVVRRPHADFYYDLDRVKWLKSQASEWAREAKNYRAELPPALKWGGRALTGVGMAVGAWSDWKDGEGVGQAVVSNGAATAVGVGTYMMTSAATGAAIGTLIPVPGVGTAVGAAAGFAVGTVVSISASSLTDKAVDYVFENHKEIADAAEKGWDKTGEVVRNAGEAAKKKWNEWFG